MITRKFNLKKVTGSFAVSGFVVGLDALIASIPLNARIVWISSDYTVFSPSSPGSKSTIETDYAATPEAAFDLFQTAVAAVASGIEVSAPCFVVKYGLTPDLNEYKFTAVTTTILSTSGLDSVVRVTIYYEVSADPEPLLVKLDNSPRFLIGLKDFIKQFKL